MEKRGNARGVILIGLGLYFQCGLSATTKRMN